MNDHDMPYHLRIPLNDLEHTIHGGGPNELYADVVFTPTERFREPHDDVPGKLRILCTKKHTHLELKVLDAIPTPAQAKKMEENVAAAQQTVDHLDHPRGPADSHVYRDPQSGPGYGGVPIPEQRASVAAVEANEEKDAPPTLEELAEMKAEDAAFLKEPESLGMP